MPAEDATDRAELAAPAGLAALQAEIALLERVRRREAQAVVVDDMQSMRMLLAQALKAAGFTRVLRAADGEAGLALMERESCDLALVDWNMPRLDGMGLLDRVRAHPRLGPMVFLLVTAENVDARVMQAAEESQDAFLSKPVSAEKLARRLELVVQRRLVSAQSRLLEAQGDSERAAQTLLMALHNQPRLRWPALALGGLMARQGRWAEAERCYARVLELDPQALGALVEMGRLREAQGKALQARRLHRQAIIANPLFFRARDALAESLAAEGRQPEALATLEEALAQGGGANAARQERLAGLAYAQGAYPRAEEALETARQLKPARQDPASRLLLARARLAQGRLDEALPALAQAALAAQAIGDDLALADALLLTVATHLRLGDPEETRLAYARLAQDDTWSGGVRPFALAHLERELAALCLQAGQDQEALAHMAASLALAPEDEVNRAALATICAEAGRPELVAQAQAEVQDRLTAEAEACSRLGLSLVARGRLDEAKAQYERGLALLPDSGRLHFNLGKLHLRLNQQEQALPSLAAAARLAVRGQDWELAAQTAGLLANLGHVPQARALLQQALTQAPASDPALVQSLALALAALPRPERPGP
jgi:two-component system chemotaxis response regulator CheY